MLAYATASMHPSKMQIPDVPFLLIAAHTRTFVGCIGLGLYLGLRPDLVQQNHLWVSICTVVSSE